MKNKTPNPKKLYFLGNTFPKFVKTWAISREIKRGKKRLDKAITIAEDLHRINNGTRYFVLEVSYRPGHYIVRNMDEIKAMQKNGEFSDRANFTDFLKEAKYYTKSECLSTVKGHVVKKTRPLLITILIWTAVIFLFLELILIVIKLW